jgi:murein DD-endopeptidase MepM/ murein hydrolase activator NlpD
LLRTGLRTIRRNGRLAAAAAVASISVAAGFAPVAASNSGGGIMAPGHPEVTDVVCVKRCVGPHKATRGAVIKVRGSSLGAVTRVVFRGANGPVRARVRSRHSSQVRAIVPRRARASRPYVVDSYGSVSNRAPRKLLIRPRSEIPRSVFPVRGPHGYGDGFGAGRGHDGTDVFASCGTRLVSALAGRVEHIDYHAAAGYYVVIDLMYAHLIRPAPLHIGQRVGAGHPIGRVGETGNAQGCHLHFEYWRGDWYGGGSPIDSMPFLKALDRKS